MTTIDIILVGGDNVGTFGYTGVGTPLFGQTFKAPNASDVFLSEFDFHINLQTTCTFKAYVYEWDVAGGKATGSALFTSSDFTPSGSYEVATFNPNITLDSSKTYICFCSTLASSGSGSGRFGFPAGDGTNQYNNTNYELYVDGQAFFLNGTNPLAAWTPFDSNFGSDPGTDLGFKAVFTGGSTPTDNSLFFAGD